MPCAPALISRKSQAVIEPSASRPARMSITAIGRRYPHWNSSARLQCTFTGRPAARARRAASMASSPCLPPKPPPVGGTITRTSASSGPNVPGELGAYREGDVVAGPDGQPSAVPFGHGCSRFERDVGEVGGGMGAQLTGHVGGPDAGCCRAGPGSAARSADPGTSGRSTAPYSMPGRSRSETNRRSPVTASSRDAAWPGWPAKCHAAGWLSGGSAARTSSRRTPARSSPYPSEGPPVSPVAAPRPRPGQRPERPTAAAARTASLSSAR